MDVRSGNLRSITSADTYARNGTRNCSATARLQTGRHRSPRLIQPRASHGVEVAVARVELADGQWRLIEPLLPPERGRPGRPSRSNWDMLNAILWMHRTGSPWRDLPEGLGPWRSAWTRFDRWARAGMRQRALEHLARRDRRVYMVDSSIARPPARSGKQKGARLPGDRPLARRAEHEAAHHRRSARAPRRGAGHARPDQRLRAR